MNKNTSLTLAAGALAVAAAFSGSPVSASVSKTITGIGSTSSWSDTGVTPVGHTLKAAMSFYVENDIFGNISRSAGTLNVTSNDTTSSFNSKLTVSCKDVFTGVITANTATSRSGVKGSSAGDISYLNAPNSICPFGRVAYSAVGTIDDI